MVFYIFLRSKSCQEWPKILFQYLCPKELCEILRPAEPSMLIRVVRSGEALYMKT